MSRDHSGSLYQSDSPVAPQSLPSVKKVKYKGFEYYLVPKNYQNNVLKEVLSKNTFRICLAVYI